jgi:hypothetical protein
MDGTTHGGAIEHSKTAAFEPEQIMDTLIEKTANACRG